ncbi:hypothetical protein [Streptomyces lydicus]|uniref:hypothetical protein n=1 Tax=Streptomyces lydicus TaxID=47763 RepID=UPI003789BA17
MIKKKCGVALAGAALLAPSVPAHAADGWQRVGDGITGGLSGLAVEGRHGAAVDVLAVRDNKQPGQNRLVSLRYDPHAKPQVSPVDWPGEPPVDLEAIDAVPGRAREYVALASDGTAYRIRRERNAVRVLRAFALPGVSPDGNYEGFALARLAHGKLVAVWADRGGDDHPAKLTAAEWNPRTSAFGKRDSAPFSAPYPAENVRHVSDLKISAGGALTVASASDPGDDGPYDSALYTAGHLAVGDHGRIRLKMAHTPERLGSFSGHKIEALACLPKSREGILGADDENAGGSLTEAAFCRP